MAWIPLEDATFGWIVGAGAVSYDRAYYIGLAILAVLLVVAIVKARGVWDEIHEEIEPVDPDELLRSFEQAHADGAIDDAEFARVKSKLATGPPGCEPPPARSLREEQPGKS